MHQDWREVAVNMSILVTGGAGFIGSHVVERLVAEFPNEQMTILDKMTYAADYENLSPVLKHGQRRLVVGDLCDFALCTELTRNVDLVVHLAAESHVDNSFGNSILFTQSNTVGTHSLLEACRVNKVGRFIHVSTDEVYGEALHGPHFETDILNPTNPYSASKAAAEMMVNAYLKSFTLPIIVVRANNIFGTRQFPEKIIPRFCVQAHLGQKFTIHGNGLNKRRYLAAEDFAEAILLVIRKADTGDIFNVASEDEYTNLEIRDMIANAFGVDGKQCTQFVTDRPFNDSRYWINCDRLLALGWRQKRQLADEMPRIAEWYRSNVQRYIHLFEPEGSRKARV